MVTNPFNTKRRDGYSASASLGRGKTALGKLREFVEEQLRATRADNNGETEYKSPRSPEWARCAESVVYWVNTYCYTYDPRVKAKSFKWVLYPRQEEFLRWLEYLEERRVPGLCEKSRGVGVSFMCAAYALHGWLFKPGYKVGFGSRKLEYVDQLGNVDSIFEKVRFMYRRLPGWMMPEGFTEGRHDCHARILNPETGSAITGEGGDSIGRGGRCSIYFVDEAAHLEHPALVEASLVETTDVRVDVSTVRGPGNPFASKRHSLPSDRVFTYHWMDDPRKNHYEVRDSAGRVLRTGNGRASLPGLDKDNVSIVYPWAEQVKREKGKVLFAQEYDIDYSASVEGICIPGAWVRAAVGLDLYGPCPVGNKGNTLTLPVVVASTHVDPRVAGDIGLYMDGLKARESSRLDRDTRESRVLEDEEFLDVPAAPLPPGAVPRTAAKETRQGTARRHNDRYEKLARGHAGEDRYGHELHPQHHTARLPDGRVVLDSQCVAGLDVGEEGNDLSVFTPRRGPVILDPVSWGRFNTTQTAWRARDEALKAHVREMCYDSIGVGAGVKGTYRSSGVSEDDKDVDDTDGFSRILALVARPINVGTVPTDAIWRDGQRSKDKFVNLKAELWWRVRERFEKTYEWVTQGIPHPPEEMISIPNHPQLIAELSLPLIEYTQAGKMAVESKSSLRRRGVKSPDFAESLVMSEACFVCKRLQFWVK